MKYNHDRLIQAKRTIALVSACSISADRAMEVARSIIGGTVFDVRLKEVERRVIWRVKLLRDGERVKVYVDAGSGRILDAKAEIAVAEPYHGTSPETLIGGHQPAPPHSQFEPDSLSTPP